MGLDSIYAMLARPVKAVFQPKREVEQVKTSSAIAPDSHEAPQSQLPPEIDKREKVADRRKEQKALPTSGVNITAARKMKKGMSPGRRKKARVRS